jgi:uncharacterized protein YwlG (UPF0340 family)
VPVELFARDCGFPEIVRAKEGSRSYLEVTSLHLAWECVEHFVRCIRQHRSIFLLVELISAYPDAHAGAWKL